MNKPSLQIQHLDLKSLASNLKLASIDVIKTSNMDIESHWFRSVGPADLYFWKAKDRIVKHQISLFDQVVEWNEYDGVKTGYVNDEIEASDTICFDEDVNTEVIEKAIEFLGHARQLEAQVVKELIQHYRFYNRWQNRGVFRFLRRIFKLFGQKPRG
ncbi:MAG: hypothetical protein AAF203_08505 [Pseudomonadota bacterium]